MRARIILGVVCALTVALVPAALGADDAKAPAGAPGEGRGRMAGRGVEAMVDVQEEFKALDADGDGQLTLREYARAAVARREFAACDKDRDGKLTKEEFASFRLGAGTGAQAGGEAMFERLDADKNGEITEAEAGRMWRMLSRSDANGDGKLSKEEWTKAREQLEKDMATRRGEEFASLDKNGDGALSFLELLGRERGGAGRAEAPAVEAGKNVEQPKGRQALGERLLRGMDTNGDGKIAKSEWTGAEERFKGLDTNGDGVIDAAEIQARTREMGRRPEAPKKAAEQPKAEEKK